MLETLAVFQPATFWLKPDANPNICAQHRPRGMRLTPRSAQHAPTKQASAAQSCCPSALRRKAIEPVVSLMMPHACDAKQHTEFMFETLAVFHLLMSPLKVGLAVDEG